MRFSLLLLLLVPLFTVAAIDTNVIVKLNNEALEMAYTNPDAAMKLADKALLLSQKHGFKRGEVRAWIRKGIVFDIQSKNDDAIRMYNKSLALAQQTRDKKAIASNFNNLGLIYYKMNRYTEALAYFSKANDMFLSLGDVDNLGSVANNVGLLNIEMQRFGKAVRSFRTALKYYAASGNDYETNNVYCNLGNLFETKNELDSALYYFNKAIAGYREMDDKYSLGIILSNLGVLHERMGRYDEAVKSLKEAMENAKAVDNMFSYVGSAASLAEIYIAHKEDDKAFELLKQAYPELPKLQSNELGFKICYELATQYLKRGDELKAAAFLKEYRKYHAAYFSETMKKDYAEMEQKFSIKEEQRKSAELIRNEKEKHFRETMFWAAGLVLLILTLLLTFFIIRKRNLQKQLENQQMVFDATMEERKRISYDLHDHVGSQLSYVVNNLELIQHENDKNDRVNRTFAMSQAAMNSLRDTVWALHTEELTLGVLAQRMENVALKTLEQQPGIGLIFKTEVESEQVISAQTTLHVMRIFQEAMHNVVKHAQADKVDVLLKEHAASYELVISDNGIGLEPEPAKPFHYGLQSMKDRAAKINGELLFQVSAGNSGTAIVLKWQKNNSIA